MLIKIALIVLTNIEIKVMAVIVYLLWMVKEFSIMVQYQNVKIVPLNVRLVRLLRITVKNV